MLEARAAVRKLKQYQPPLGDRSGLRLDFNENTGGCSPRVMERLRQLQPEQLACYPEREPVERAVASFLGLQPEQVLLTNGVDEAIHLVCEAYLEPEDDALVVVPTFAMYQICMAATGARVISIPADENFRFPTSKVMAYTTAPRTRLIAIANPNNPTGAVASADDLLLIARSAPQAAVLVDEAYFEFYGESLLEYAGQVPNLFIARTFSKAYGMASLRVGVLAGAAEQIQSLRRACSPLQRERRGPGLSARGAGRPGIRSPLCGRGEGEPQPAGRRISCPGNSLLAEPGKFCAGADRAQPRGFCPRHESARDSGARPVVRFRLRRLRSHHRRLAGTHGTPSGRAARDLARDRLERRDTAMRRARIVRKTQETAIRAVLNIDGRGRYKVSTGIRFFDHMLELFARHGGFDLELQAKGDLDVDQHHTVEDVGIVLGEAFHQALGSKRGILRAGYFVMPMDETLGLAAVDFGGRASSVVDTKVRQRLVGDLQAELVYDFFEGFARGARANVHARVLYGRSNHHKIESLFKAFSRALRAACWRDRRMARLLPSTKGLL